MHNVAHLFSSSLITPFLRKSSLSAQRLLEMMASHSVALLHHFLRPPRSCNSFLVFGLNPPSSVRYTRCSRFDNSNEKKKKKPKRGLLSVSASSSTEQPEEIISGEWPENFSLLNYDDLRAYLEPEIFKDKLEPSALLGEVMSTTIRTTRVNETLEEINHHFEIVSGLPVIDEQFKCIGVVSKKDNRKASHGLASKVSEVMSSPAITLSPNKTVLDAAALMLKEKIHRIPIVNEEGQVVGMVTRTDIFKALEGLPA